MRWKCQLEERSFKIDIWATAQERSVTETAKECGCSVSTVKRCKRMKLEQQSLWECF